MGLNTGYVLVKGLSRDELLTRLGAKVGGPVELPLSWKAPISLGPTVQGWTIIGDPWGRVGDSPRRLVPLSRDATVISGCLQETTMYSQAVMYVDGRFRWKVFSDCSKPDERGVHVVSKGDAPQSLAERIRRAREKELQTGGDHQFNVPLDLITEATGGVISGRYPWHDEEEGVVYRELIFAGDDA